jgi:hypothetical protein
VVDARTLYYPLHIDRVGRHYQKGESNVTNASFLRPLLLPHTLQVSKICFKAIPDITKKDFLTPLSGEIRPTSIYIEKSKRDGVCSLIWLDAKASVLQILSLLTGDIKLAQSCGFIFEDNTGTILSSK